MLKLYKLVPLEPSHGRWVGGRGGGTQVLKLYKLVPVEPSHGRGMGGGGGGKERGNSSVKVIQTCATG